MPARIAGLAVPLLLAGALLARPPLPEAKGHDLRGPALKKGLVLTVKATSSIKDADLELTGPDDVIKTKTSTTQSRELKHELLAVEGRTTTKQRVTVVKMKQTSTVMGTEIEVPTPLAGHAFVCAKVNGEWKVKPEKAGADLPGSEDAMLPWLAEDDLYPARRVKVGESWAVGAKAMQKYYGEWARMTDVTGKMKGKLRAVEKFQGERCAVVDFEARVKGKLKAGATVMSYEATSRITVYRSLSSGINLKKTSEVSRATSYGEPTPIKMKGKEKVEMVATVKAR
jgi:hypothetical protein